MNGSCSARKMKTDTGFLKVGKYMETKHYTVIRIEGEYATLADRETGAELFIAMALLPEETDIGVKLLWEDLEYSVEE